MQRQAWRAAQPKRSPRAADAATCACTRLFCVIEPLQLIWCWNDRPPRPLLAHPCGPQHKGVEGVCPASFLTRIISLCGAWWTCRALITVRIISLNGIKPHARRVRLRTLPFSSFLAAPDAPRATPASLLSGGGARAASATAHKQRSTSAAFHFVSAMPR